MSDKFFWVKLLSQTSHLKVRAPESILSCTLRTRFELSENTRYVIKANITVIISKNYIKAAYRIYENSRLTHNIKKVKKSD